ncbi:MAG: DUF2268 domain-containing putative Zn-dependent protease [Candidatus Dormiibacterota bacterium]
MGDPKQELGLPIVDSPQRGILMSMGRALPLTILAAVLLAGCADVVPRLPLQASAAGDRFAVTLTQQVVNEASGHNFALEALTRADLSRISELLPGPNTSVTVTIGIPDQILAPVGVSGFTDPETGAITVGLYPRWADEPLSVISGLARTLAREVDRSVRITQGAGLGKSLLDELVTDGIATEFGQFAFPGPPDPWIGALSAGQECQQWRHLEPVLSNHGLHGEVLDGGRVSRGIFGEATMPPLTGKTIGYDIVAGYLGRHPGTSWTSLDKLAAKDVLAASGYAPCSSS